MVINNLVCVEVLDLICSRGCCLCSVLVLTLSLFIGFSLTEGLVGSRIYTTIVYVEENIKTH